MLKRLISYQVAETLTTSAYVEKIFTNVTIYRYCYVVKTPFKVIYPVTSAGIRLLLQSVMFASSMAVDNFKSSVSASSYLSFVSSSLFRISTGSLLSQTVIFRTSII